jgi:Fanconi anemia group M protein
VRIVVDVHEQQSGIADVLAHELGAEVEVASLPAGDYAVDADTLVERKRVRDLHSAVTKGRLWPQLAKLRAAVPFPYLLVEGTDIDRGPLSANAIRGACLAAIDQGIALLRSGQPRDSALWIHRLAVRSQRAEPPAERPAYVQRPKAPAGPEAAEALLAAVPGISATSARALLERFGSVAGVISAGPEEWRAVPGIGAERARALGETLGYRFDAEARQPSSTRSTSSRTAARASNRERPPISSAGSNASAR